MACCWHTGWECAALAARALQAAPGCRGGGEGWTGGQAAALTPAACQPCRTGCALHTQRMHAKAHMSSAPRGRERTRGGGGQRPIRTPLDGAAAKAGTGGEATAPATRPHAGVGEPSLPGLGSNSTDHALAGTACCITQSESCAAWRAGEPTREKGGKGRRREIGRVAWAARVVEIVSACRPALAPVASPLSRQGVRRRGRWDLPCP